MTNTITEICEVKSAAARVVSMTVLVYPTACAGTGKQHWMNLKKTQKKTLDQCQVLAK